MELKKKRHARKTKKLRTVFIEFVFGFCAMTFVSFALVVAVFGLLFSKGIILPGYYGERMITEKKDLIAKCTTVTPEMIPDTCQYAVFTRNGRLLSGNLSAEAAGRAWNSVQGKDGNLDSMYHYSQISRKNEICVIRYSYMVQFRSAVLRHALPYPEQFFSVLLVCSFILEVFLLASFFGRRLVRKMENLQSATEKIQNQDLDFTVEPSGIQEIDEVLLSLDKMKETLKVSLKKQWKMEKERRKQISALAHDIKTPLTVVQGNADLLTDTVQTQEQAEYTAFIKESAEQMGQYIRTLIEISKAESGYSLCKTQIESKTFLESICVQITALAALKKLELISEIKSVPVSFCADYDLLQRAVLNIVSNAADFSPEQGTLYFRVSAAENRLRFCVTDQGKGFSADALKNAALQFYMADQSRTSKAHYGMGLFIAKSIAEQHGGTLSIANSACTGGGEVTIEIPAE